MQNATRPAVGHPTSWCCWRWRECEPGGTTRRVGAGGQAAAEGLDARAHAGEAKPGAAGRQHWLGATGRAVAYLDEEVAVEDEADLDGGAGGVLHGVRQPLLNDAARRFLHGWRELAFVGQRADRDRRFTGLRTRKPFGPALAARGVAVFAADQVGFEDRRVSARGTAVGADDWLEYYNAMAYRLLRGELLMSKVLADASVALSLVAARRDVDAARLRRAGHSMGGNTVLFHAALDARIRFGCVSGAGCTFGTRIKHQTGIEMASIIPGLLYGRVPAPSASCARLGCERIGSCERRLA